MSKYIKPTIQFMAFVRDDPGSRVMATEDTADTFNLYFDGVEWMPNIDRRGYTDPQMGEDEFQRALATARRLIVLTYRMQQMKNELLPGMPKMWYVRSRRQPCEACGATPEDALDALRELEAKHEADLAAQASGKSNWKPAGSASVTFEG
jgi:hypothetical protein